MPNCPECNFPYEEGQKFCNTCGTKLPSFIKQKVCPVCGNTLLENTKVCNICGTPVNVPQDTTAAEEIAKQKEALVNPTMDEIEIPEITDEMLGLTEEPVKTDDMPTMDSIFMPGQEPAKKPKPVAISKPAPAQPTPMQTPNVPPTPQVQQPYQQTNQMPQNQYQQPQMAQNTAPNNQYVQTNMPAQNQIPQPVIQPGANNYSQPQMQPNQGFAQNNIPQNNMQQNSIPMNSIPQNNIPQGMPRNGANGQSGQPGKSFKDLLPLILIGAIVLVILIDVFVLFRNQIFGNKANSNASVITIEDDTVNYIE